MNNDTPSRTIASKNKKSSHFFIETHPAHKAQFTQWFKIYNAFPFDVYTKAVFLSLLEFSGPSGEVWPSQNTIAENAGCSERKVRDCLEVLKSFGLLFSRSVKTERGRRNIYSLITPHHKEFWNLKHVKNHVEKSERKTDHRHEVPPPSGYSCRRPPAPRASELDPVEEDPNDLESINGHKKNQDVEKSERITKGHDVTDHLKKFSDPDRAKEICTDWMELSKKNSRAYFKPKLSVFLRDLRKLMSNAKIGLDEAECMVAFIEHDDKWKHWALSPGGLMKKMGKGKKKWQNLLTAMHEDKGFMTEARLHYGF